jgi:hypothetical protein
MSLKRLTGLACLALAASSISLTVSQAATVRIPAQLRCDARSSDAVNWSQNTASIVFIRSGNRLVAHRNTIKTKGAERFTGSIAADGTISIRSRGEHFGQMKWSRTFSGKGTRLVGQETRDDGAVRNCVIDLKAGLTVG